MIGSRHVTAAPILRTTDRTTQRIEHHDKAGQIGIFSSQPIVHPRTQTGTSAQKTARIHHEHRRSVNGRLGGHRMDESDVIHAFAQMGKQIGNPLATFTVLLELPARFNNSTFVFVSAAAKCLHLDRLVIHPDHVWLVIERIDLAWPTIHVEEDHVLCLRGKRGRFGGERILKRSHPVGSQTLFGQEALFCQHRGQRHTAKTSTGLPQKFASRPTAKLSRPLLAHDITLRTIQSR